jgi:hypothetical protein
MHINTSGVRNGYGETMAHMSFYHGATRVHTSCTHHQTMAHMSFHHDAHIIDAYVHELFTREEERMMVHISQEMASSRARQARCCCKDLCERMSWHTLRDHELDSDTA